MSRYLHTVQPGRLDWIGLRPERKAPVLSVVETQALLQQGLQGDRKGRTRTRSRRQVTLINAEDIKTLASLMGKARIDPAILRRNLVVSGINLHALRYHCLQIGECIVQLGAHCHPCARMEEALGEGGFMNMYGYGGYCAEVLQGGRIQVGNAVSVVKPPEAAEGGE